MKKTLKKHIVTIILCGAIMTTHVSVPAEAASKVYITGSHTQTGKVYGTKYHKTKKCRSLKRSKKNIVKISVKKAKKKGYKKCKLCWR